MKNIFKNVWDKFRSLKINLLDGQRRGEIVFRRLFVLIVGAALIYLLLLAFVGKKDQNTQEVEAVETIQEVAKEEWVNGDRVIEKADGTVEVVPAEVFMESSVTAIKRFTQTYSGSRIDDKYFALLDENCSDEALRIVVAISVAETSMGKNTTNQSNFWGWFKGGNRKYDPSREEMAKEICRGVQKSYMNVGLIEKVTAVYTGNDRVQTWTKNFNWAMSQM